MAMASERELRRQIRDELVSSLSHQGIGVDELADRTGLLPAGARALLQRKDWSLEACLLVAHSLEYEIHTTLSSKSA